MSRIGSGPDGMPPEDLYRGPSSSQSVQSAIQSPGSGSGTGLLDGLLPGASVMWNILSYFHGQKKADERLAKQREWQLEDWRRMTEYNSPAAVISRMRSAGLNPDLLVGGNGAGSNATMPSQGSVPSGPQAHPLSVIDAIAQAREQARLQNELVESQIHLNEAEADSKRSESQNDAARVVIERMLANSKVKVDDATITQLLKSADYLVSQKVAQDTINKRLDSTLVAELNKLKADQRLSDAQRRQINRAIFELEDTWSSRKAIIENNKSLTYEEQRKAYAEAETAMLEWAMRSDMTEPDAEYLVKYVFTGQGQQTRVLGMLKGIAERTPSKLITGQMYPGAAK